MDGTLEALDELLRVGFARGFQRWVHVVRAEGLPSESFLVEVELVANEGQGCTLMSGRSEVQSGPDPIYHNSILLDWDDEGDMAVNCKERPLRCPL